LPLPVVTIRGVVAAMFKRHRPAVFGRALGRGLRRARKVIEPGKL